MQSGASGRPAFEADTVYPAAVRVPCVSSGAAFSLQIPEGSSGKSWWATPTRFTCPSDQLSEGRSFSRQEVVQAENGAISSEWTEPEILRLAKDVPGLGIGECAE